MPSRSPRSGSAVRGAAVKRIANLELRPDELQLLVDGKRANLTVREFQLFSILVDRLGSVVQRPDIYNRIWGGTMPKRDRSVDVLVRKIRAKLIAVAPEWRYIHTHFGIGYRLAPERLDGAEANGGGPPAQRST